MPDRIVELKPRPRDQVIIRLAGGRFFAVPEPSAATLVVGQSLGDADIDRLARVDQYTRGKEKVLRLLALRARTRKEVATALASLGVEHAIARGIVLELEEAGLIDDERYAHEYVRVKSDVRRLGPHRLRHELTQKGVAREVVEDVLNEELGGDRQEEMARDLAERKTAGRPLDEKAVRRVAGLLRRKGYDYEVVNRVAYDLLRRSQEDVEEFE